MWWNWSNKVSHIPCINILNNVKQLPTKYILAYSKDWIPSAQPAQKRSLYHEEQNFSKHSKKAKQIINLIRKTLCIYCITNITNPLQIKFFQQIIQEAEILQIQYLRKYCTVYGTALRHIILGLNTSNRNLLKYAKNTMFPLYRCL